MRVPLASSDPAAADPGSAVARYRALAQSYDRSCRMSFHIREHAVAALALQPGETVLDIGCGTGGSLALLERGCGKTGRVIGIEQSPEMAAFASERARALGPHVHVVNRGVQDVRGTPPADAMLLAYTHDILQSPEAVAGIVALARPGCRFALAGIRFLPWSWGFALNAFTAARARGYIGSTAGLRQPWALLAPSLAEFRIVRTYFIGTNYLAVGRFR